jgi:hypothetical protein
MIICGSQFPDDANGDYSYGVLSRIMMCVEAGKPLILTDLDIIYGLPFVLPLVFSCSFRVAPSRSRSLLLFLLLSFVSPGVDTLTPQVIH